MGEKCGWFTHTTAPHIEDQSEPKWRAQDILAVTPSARCPLSNPPQVSCVFLDDYSLNESLFILKTLRIICISFIRYNTKRQLRRVTISSSLT
jgi:hypothetical protein